MTSVHLQHPLGLDKCGRCYSTDLFFALPGTTWEDQLPSLWAHDKMSHPHKICREEIELFQSLFCPHQSISQLLRGHFFLIPSSGFSQFSVLSLGYLELQDQMIWRTKVQSEHGTEMFSVTSICF